jgi:isoleucyl-tRNA synthetase
MSSDDKSQFALVEEEVLQLWQQEGTFQESLDQRKGKTVFSFYDGPPFANGLPHWGHTMTSVLKDAVCRYKTMQGFYVPRRFGWDCHGLPPELEVEKQLGVHGKKAIREYGLDKFVNACRVSVLQYTDKWHAYVQRIGRWVDFDDDYRTMDTSYTESVWWAFKTLYDKGLIYEDVRVVPYSYGAETSLSFFETRLDDSFRDREDIAVTFIAQMEDGRKALVWTTVPWTIPANLLLAVGQDITYTEVELDGEVYVIAVDAIANYPKLEGAKKKKTFLGKDLVGLKYTPVFDYFSDTENAFRFVAADFVETDAGTGVVSIAPGHGEEDFWIGKKESMPIISPVDDQGRFTVEVKDYVGRLVFDTNNEIVIDLEKNNKLFDSGLYVHKYPHCWRTDVPIIYRAMDSWFLDVPKIKEEMVKLNKGIDWHPDHVRDGAVGKWLENAREWNISRKRFWGAPIPIWKTDDGEVIVIGSIEELKQRAAFPADLDDLHQPWINEVVIKTEDGRLAHRVEDVFDCWFESGSMPFASLHYPFENKKEFEDTHPGDFITEYIGQTRGWFYTLHVMSVALFDKPAFKSAVAHGVILGTDGRKMSKRLGNYPPLETVFDSTGADAVRLYLLGSSLFNGETASFDNQSLTEAQRNIIQRLNNSVSFFNTYAKVDNWKPSRELSRPESSHVLDQWILARLDQTIVEMTKEADVYNTPKLIKSLFEMIDDLSNWYIRRSRRRFWKAEDDSDKAKAYETLHYVLVKTCQLLAPWAPFASDNLYRQLVENTNMPKSVHLTDWPSPSEEDSSGLLSQMVYAREYINNGLAQRAAAGIKVRQPLSEVSIPRLSPELKEIVAEELNVKSVKDSKDDDVVLNTILSADLRSEGLVRDLIRIIQNNRKKAGLKVEDRIKLVVLSDSKEVNEAVKKHMSTIRHETLALELLETITKDMYNEETKINGQQIQIGLKKSV